MAVDQRYRASIRPFLRAWWDGAYSAMSVILVVAGVLIMLSNRAMGGSPNSQIEWIALSLIAVGVLSFPFLAFHSMRLERDKAKDRGVKPGWAKAIDELQLELRVYSKSANIPDDYKTCFPALIKEARGIVERFINPQEVILFDEHVRPRVTKEIGESKTRADLHTTLRAADSFLDGLKAKYRDS